MSKEWICADCECVGTDACYYNVRDGKYPACSRIVVDHDKAYQHGREDAIDEFAMNIIGHFHFVTMEEEWILKMAEQLKEQTDE